ncbi:MAG: hypothetical protein LBE35_00035 [Clostridiales bacterium]|jgi:shikimate dehydrogenase|nr:hypothetical protein [Clostridiales bacterium]
MNLNDLIQNVDLGGLIGQNITNSLSPHIHNLLATAMSHNLHYMPFNVEPHELEEAVAALHKFGVGGVNVTAPHKTAVLPLTFALHESAERVQSVNLLKYTNSGYIGYNTDIDGILEILKYFRVEKVENSTIFGAGGVARAAVDALSQLGCRRLTIINRSEENADNLLRFALENYEMEAKIAAEPARGDLFMQATSATPEELVRLLPKLDFSVVFDMNYPAGNPWLTQVKKPGIMAFDGVGMLVFQAVKAYQITWHKIIPKFLAENLFANLNRFF